MSTAPVRPSGGYIERAGQTIPLELAYRGTDDEGLHIWVSATPYNALTDRLHFDLLPARTAIVFATEIERNTL